MRATAVGAGAPPQPQIQQALLQRGHVLILINHKMAVLLADTHGDILTIPQNPHHQQQHIFKVDSAPVSFNLFISLQQSRDSFRL